MDVRIQQYVWQVLLLVMLVLVFLMGTAKPVIPRGQHLIEVVKIAFPE
jgi:hypothetical protein